MLPVKYLLAGVYFFIPCVFGTLGASFRTQQSQQDPMCSADSLTNFGIVENVIACSRICSNTAGCRGFHFDETNNRCWGSNQTRCQALAGAVYYQKAVCPPGWLQIESSCYKVSNSTSTLGGGLTFCQATYPSFDAYMVQLETAVEDVAVVSNIMQTYPSTTFCLGLHDPLKDRVWVWMATGVPMVYSNWLPGQPDSLAQFYVQVAASDNYQWRDLGPAKICTPLCEISLL